MNWWIARTERTLTEDVPAPPERVRALYVDLDSLKVVHPLIVSVEETSRTVVAGGYEQSYRVVDRMTLGPVRFRIAYRASWQVPEAGDVLTEAHQSPAVHLQGRVSFDEVPGGTRITERVLISAPRGLLGLTAREAVTAHAVMLSRIRDHFTPG